MEPVDNQKTMSLRAGLIAINALLMVVLALRLLALKRTIVRYKPPSPLPKTPTWSDLTITRVS